MKLVSISELVPMDIVWLERALQEDYHGTTVEEILDEGYQIWRLEEGIAVSRIYEYRKGKELLITHLAGKGFLRNLENLKKVWKEFARVQNCRWWAVIALRKGLIKIYENHGKNVGTIFVEEL